MRILQDLGRPGFRQVAPGVGAGTLTRRIVHVSGLRIDYVGALDSGAASVLCGPGRLAGNRDIAELVLASFEDEGEIGGGRFAQGSHSRRKTGRRTGASAIG